MLKENARIKALKIRIALFMIIPLYDVYRSKNTIFPFFFISWSNTFRYCGHLIIPCSFDYLAGVYCRFLYLNRLSAGCCRSASLSTYIYQVYEDNRWWISRYQTLKGRCILMIYVGIDVAKLNHFASVLSSEGEVLVGPFEFTNDGDGFQYLVSAFEPFENNEIIIGLESTAHYGDNLVRYLVAEGFNVCVINPIQTSTMRKF